jgi:hypothetical protein
MILQIYNSLLNYSIGMILPASQSIAFCGEEIYVKFAQARLVLDMAEGSGERST